MKMTTMAQVFTVACLVLTACGSIVESNVTDADLKAIADMKADFARSEDAHKKSMDALMQSMSNTEALDILRANPEAHPDLLELAGVALQTARGSLRASKKAQALQPKGYAGVDKARKLLNEMIGESMAKYDLEIAKCTDYYSKTCGLMEECRGDISASNYKAAESRKHILAAQTQIDISNVNLPKLTVELSQHKLKCKHEIHQLKTRIAVVMGDISIMTSILKMTDCDAKSFVDLASSGLLHCKNSCNADGFISFQDNTLRDKVSQLRSSQAMQLLKENFADLVNAAKEASVELIQGEVRQLGANDTEDNMPPIPRTEVPGNPCNYDGAGAPNSVTKGKAGCSINRMPKCYKLQERFMLIQSGIMDDRDFLKESLSALEAHCKELEDTLQTSISDEEVMLKEEGTKLAEATTEESNSGENARLVGHKHEELESDLHTMMTSCQKNYINFETEQCGLKKIRGELAKLVGGPTGQAPFYQDCTVSKWEPDECSKKCAGGVETITRNIQSQPNGGAECLPLKSTRRCNDFPCPVNCKLEPWTGWSRCTAQCGGGVEQRLRSIKVQMKHNGEPCGETSETRSCNVQACEKDCELMEWTQWSQCSKECDGGTRKRQKFIKEAALGEGKCASPWEPARLEYKECNTQACEHNLRCDAKIDIVLALDGSGSLGKKGWANTKKFAKLFVEAFDDKKADVELAVLQYSGPRTWGGVSVCMGEAVPKTKLDLDNTCKIHWVQHFTKSKSDTLTNLEQMQWHRGGTLTSLALGTVKDEIPLGRKGAQTVVVVATDGRPLSFKRTLEAAKELRKKARLMFVPVTKNAPLKDIKSWASRRWEENVVQVDDFDTLSKVDTIDRIVADICPNVHVALPPDTTEQPAEPQ